MARKTSRVNFTIKTIAEIAMPPSGRSYVYDTRTPGLALCTTSNGTRTWYWIGRVHGKPQRVRLGTFPSMSIENARGKAAATAAKVHGGEDPMQVKRDARNSKTVGQVWEEYKTRWLLARCRPGTIRSDLSRWKTCFADWSERKMVSITHGEIVDRHTQIGSERGKINANRAVELLRRVYTFANKVLGLQLGNPAVGVQMFPEEERERFFDAQELDRFFESIAVEKEPFGDFFFVVLLTGARRGNVMSMQWNHIDFAKRTWTIPGEEFKTGKSQTVILAPSVIEVLERRKLEAESQWVFPGRKKGDHLREPMIAWRRITKRAKLTNARIHDLRRTLGSWQAGRGSSLSIIGKSLGQTRPETTAIYARLNLDPVRESVEGAVEDMTKHRKRSGESPKKDQRNPLGEH